MHSVSRSTSICRRTGPRPHPASISPVSKKQVRLVAELARFWQDRFCLQSYDIKVLITADCPNFEEDEDLESYCHAATGAEPGIRMATVWINPMVFADPRYAAVEALSGLVAHEFFHIAFHDEVVVLQESMLNVLSGSDVVKGRYCKDAYDINERLTRVMEGIFLQVPVPEKIRRLAA